MANISIGAGFSAPQTVQPAMQSVSSQAVGGVSFMKSLQSSVVSGQTANTQQSLPLSEQAVQSIRPVDTGTTDTSTAVSGAATAVDTSNAGTELNTSQSDSNVTVTDKPAEVPDDGYNAAYENVQSGYNKVKVTVSDETAEELTALSANAVIPKNEASTEIPLATPEAVENTEVSDNVTPQTGQEETQANAGDRSEMLQTLLDALEEAMRKAFMELSDPEKEEEELEEKTLILFMKLIDKINGKTDKKTALSGDEDEEENGSILQILDEMTKLAAECMQNQSDEDNEEINEDVLDIVRKVLEIRIDGLTEKLSSSNYNEFAQRITPVNPTEQNMESEGLDPLQITDNLKNAPERSATDRAGSENPNGREPQRIETVSPALNSSQVGLADRELSIGEEFIRPTETVGSTFTVEVEGEPIRLETFDPRVSDFHAQTNVPAAEQTVISQNMQTSAVVENVSQIDNVDYVPEISLHTNVQTETSASTFSFSFTDAVSNNTSTYVESQNVNMNRQTDFVPTVGTENQPLTAENKPLIVSVGATENEAQNNFSFPQETQVPSFTLSKEDFVFDNGFVGEMNEINQSLQLNVNPQPENRSEAAVQSVDTVESVQSGKLNDNSTVIQEIEMKAQTGTVERVEGYLPVGNDPNDPMQFNRFRKVEENNDDELKELERLFGIQRKHKRQRIEDVEDDEESEGNSSNASGSSSDAAKNNAAEKSSIPQKVLEEADSMMNKELPNIYIEDMTMAVSKTEDAPIAKANGTNNTAAKQVVGQFVSEALNNLPVQGGESTFVMTLNPETLGKITVKMVENAGKVSVSIAAENRETAAILASRAENVQESMRDSGTQLEKYQVVYSPEESSDAQQQNYDGSSKNPYVRHYEEHEEGNEGQFKDFLENAV